MSSPSSSVHHGKPCMHMGQRQLATMGAMWYPFECKITGTGQGSARIKASIHTRLESFDEEEWRIITLTVGHMDSRFQYTDLFAPSCGSIGDFTDIFTDVQKYDEGYVVPQMRDYNFQVRNFDGTFYEQVFPFDPFYFCTKVHPTGALLLTPHHSQLTLLQHLCIQFQYAKMPLRFSLIFQNTGLKMMALWALMKATAGNLPRHCSGSEFMACTRFLATSKKSSEGWSITVIEVDLPDMEPSPGLW